MNEFLTPLSRVVYEHRSTLDKTIGERLMTFRGAPVPSAEHVDQAVMVAMRTIQKPEQSWIGVHAFDIK